MSTEIKERVRFIERSDGVIVRRALVSLFIAVYLTVDKN